MSSRHQMPFRITLTADQARYLTDNGQSSERGELQVRVSGDSLAASWPPSNSFDHPPSCTAQIARSSGGVTVSGTIDEARSNGAEVWIWRIATVIMLAIAGGSLIGLAVHPAAGGVAVLALGVVGSLCFALLWRSNSRGRKPAFDTAAGFLSDGLTRYLTTGDGARRWV